MVNEIYPRTHLSLQNGVHSIVPHPYGRGTISTYNTSCMYWVFNLLSNHDLVASPGLVLQKIQEPLKKATESLKEIQKLRK